MAQAKVLKTHIVLPVLIQSLLLATAGLFAPGSMTLVILLLMSARGWRNGLGYVLGYFSGYTLLGSGMVLVGYRFAPQGNPEASPFLSGLFFALGALLVGLGFRNGRQSAPPTDRPSRFFALVDRVTPFKAYALGALVSMVNFKNLALFFSAMSVVVLSPLSLAEKLALVPPVVAVFCFAVLIPLLIYLAFPRRAADLLNGIKSALERHGRLLSIWAPLIFGLLLIIRGWTLLP